MTSLSIAELNKIVDELSTLLVQAKTEHVIAMLKAEKLRIEEMISSEKNKNEEMEISSKNASFPEFVAKKCNSQTSDSQSESAVMNGGETWRDGLDVDGAVSFQSYSWSQSKKFVSVYIPCTENVDEGEKNISLETRFAPRKFAFLVTMNAKDGKRKKFLLQINNLCKAIDLNQSKATYKASRKMFQIKLRKAQSEGEQDWSDLTDEKDKKEEQRKHRLQTSLKDASTAELLSDMYKHASDEDRKKLAGAWHKGRSKREGRA